MKKSILCILCFIIILSTVCNAQNKEAVPFDRFAMGVGGGFDYGGFGFNLTGYPQKNIGLFAGAGYAVGGIGVNAGIKFRVVSKKAFNPFAIAMYGYNAAVAVTNYSQYNKLFYGPTVGAGFDLVPRSRKGYFSFAILVPIRSEDEDNYMHDLTTNNGVIFKNKLLPIGISVGYKFIFR